jgi:hypothetical protein
MPAARFNPLGIEDLFSTSLPTETHPLGSPTCPACTSRRGSVVTGTLCASCRRLEQAGPHRWRWCTVCGLAALVPSGRKCLLTFACTGHHETPLEVAA